MIDSPVPSQLEVIATLFVLLGAPFATVITIVIILDVAGWIRFGQASVIASRGVARGVADSVYRGLSHRRGQLVTLAATQALFVATVYLAARWVMFFPRSPWLGQSTGWGDRVGYLFGPPGWWSPEATAAFVVLGVAAVAGATVFRERSVAGSLAAGVQNITGGAGVVLGVLAAGAGAIGVAFFTLSIGSVAGSIRTDEIKVREVLEAEISRDSAATLLVLGLLGFAVWGAAMLAQHTIQSIRAQPN